MEAINICTKNLKDIYNLRISNVNSGEGNV